MKTYTYTLKVGVTGSDGIEVIENREVQADSYSEAQDEVNASIPSEKGRRMIACSYKYNTTNKDKAMTNWTNKNDTMGKIAMDNGLKFCWMRGQDGEISGHVEDEDGAIIGTHGWYRTTNEIAASKIAADNLTAAGLMNGPKTVSAEQIIDLMNRSMSKLMQVRDGLSDDEDLTRFNAKIQELEYLLGRVTSHKMNIRSIEVKGD